jgi:hypothetical protein
MIPDPPPLPCERQVAGMKRPHGRHEGNLAAVAAKRGDGSPKRIDLTDYLHGCTASDTR